MLIGSIINVASVHLLLPYIGLQASNIALFLGFLGLCISRIVLLKKEIKLRIDYPSIVLLGISFGLVTIVYVKANMILNLLALVVACFVTCFIFRDILKKMYYRVRGR